jgi:hypothetical protein
MIALFFAVAAQAAAPAAPAAPSVLGAIGQQRLPAKGCAAYLWNPADRQLVAMAVADPATLRLSIGGKTIDLARSGGEGPGRLGFADAIDYRGGDLSVRLSMEIVQQDGLTAGARVPSGSLQIERPGQDAIAVPVAGLIGCRS